MARVLEGPIWVYILPGDLDPGPVAGKWLYRARFGLLALSVHILGRLVDNGVVAAAKYARADPRGRFGPAAERFEASQYSLLCLYTQKTRDREVKGVFEALTSLETETWVAEAAEGSGKKRRDRLPVRMVHGRKVKRERGDRDK